MLFSNDILYGAYNVRATVVNPDGSEREGGFSTIFGLRLGPEVLVFPTARHVVDPSFADPSFVGSKLVELETKGRSITEGGVPTGYFSTTWDRFGVCWPSDNVSDVALVYSPKVKDGVPIHLNAYSSNGVPIAKTLSALTVGASVGAIGYPEHHDEVDLRPLFRSGNVASDPRYPYAIRRVGEKQQHRGQIVAYDGFSSGGLSGAPVWWHINDNLVYLVGVNAGHLTTQVDRYSVNHSGLSYFYRIDVLANLANGLCRAKGWTLPFPTYPTSDTMMAMEVGGTAPMALQEVSTAAVDRSPDPADLQENESGKSGG